jgi:Transposase, Mutator family
MSAARPVAIPEPAITSATPHTKAGEVWLKVPKFRRQTFATAIIERYRRRGSSVEEALIEIYPAPAFQFDGLRTSQTRCGACTCLRRRCRTLTTAAKLAAATFEETLS